MTIENAEEDQLPFLFHHHFLIHLWLDVYFLSWVNAVDVSVINCPRNFINFSCSFFFTGYTCSKFTTSTLHLKNSLSSMLSREIKWRGNMTTMWMSYFPFIYSPIACVSAQEMFIIHFLEKCLCRAQLHVGWTCIRAHLCYTGFIYVNHWIYGQAQI